MTNTWLIEIAPDRVLLQRLHQGSVIESYRAVDHGTAVIYLAAVIRGFQPPRDLVRLDTPSG